MELAKEVRLPITAAIAPAMQNRLTASQYRTLCHATISSARIQPPCKTSTQSCGDVSGVEGGSVPRQDSRPKPLSHIEWLNGFFV